VSTFIIFLVGVSAGFVIGYPFGLFIDKLDKRSKRNGIR
jgi:NhaP-type Na+/H+ or K+/H+ antiporter